EDPGDEVRHDEIRVAIAVEGEAVTGRGRRVDAEEEVEGDRAVARRGGRLGRGVDAGVGGGGRRRRGRQAVVVGPCRLRGGRTGGGRVDLGPGARAAEGGKRAG